MKLTKSLTIAFLLLIPAVTVADYVFGVDPNAKVSECSSTDWTDEQTKQAFNQSFDCDGVSDVKGTYILTCKDVLGRAVAMVYKTKDLETCKSLYSSTKKLLGQ